MSILEQVEYHERMESLYAKAAVRGLQSGVRHGANLDMELSAQHRHLAFELVDTEKVAAAAFYEYIDERTASYHAARNAAKVSE